MKRTLLTIVLLISFYFGYSQPTYNDTHDPQAKTILDKLSAKLKDKTARIYFLYSFYNAQDSSKTDYYGYLFVKGENKYKVIIPDAEVFTDGVKNYNYNKKNNEMNITFADPANDMAYSPQKMLTSYKSGYKYSYRGEITFDAKTKVNGKVITKSKTCHIIDLYPENPKKSDFSIIRIWIDKNANELVSIKYQLNNGIEEVVEVLNFDVDVNINDDIFKFDASRYPANLDIIDFTE